MVDRPEPPVARRDLPFERRVPRGIELLGGRIDHQYRWIRENGALRTLRRLVLDILVPQTLSGATGDFLRQIDCVNSSYCVAVGGSGLQAGFQPGIAPAAAGWDGSRWSAVATSAPEVIVSILDGVSCAGLSECFAGGFGITPSDRSVDIQSLLEKFDLAPGYSLAGSDGGTFNFGSAKFRRFDERAAAWMLRWSP